MMKRVFFILLFSLGLASAQGFYHTKNAKSITLSYGINEHSLANGFIEYNHWLHRNFSVGGAFNFEHGKVGSTYFNDYVIAPHFKASPTFALGGRIYFNGFFGAYFGVQHLLSDRYPQEKVHFINGIWLGGEMEVQCFKNFAIGLQGRQAYTFQAEAPGHWHYNFNINFKLLLF